MNKTFFVLLCFIGSFHPSLTYANDKSTLIEDVTFLASERLEGRANFSKGMDVARHYIYNRFKTIGLEPLPSNNSFFQYVPVYQYENNNQSLVVNGQPVPDANFAVVSTTPGNSTYSLATLKVTTVSAGEELRAVVSGLNRAGGNHLVVMTEKHKKWFTIYKNHFARGLTKGEKSPEGTIILLLREDVAVQSVAATVSVNLEVNQLVNVIGQIPGKSLKHEKVLYTAHYDHLGVKSTTSTDDKIYNGADDNASGTSSIINLASRFKASANNERTLIFAAFAGEEIGGFGSKFFSKELAPDAITAMVNIEMVGKPSKFGAGAMWMTGPKRSNLLQLINNKLAPLNLEIYSDPYPKQRLFYRSDNASLAAYGVPAHSFSTTQLDKDMHYHQVTDEVNTLDLDSMHEVVNTIALFGQYLNDGSITPSRIALKEQTPGGKIY